MSPTGRVIRVVAGLPELYRVAAEEFVARTARAVGARGLATVALAGGSTPRGLYGLLAGDNDTSFRARVPWHAVHFFWGDERHVPPDHPDSNYRMAREALLSRVPVPPRNVHRIPTENPDATAAAAAYEQELSSFFTGGGRGSGPFPRFDLVLLGMGSDGHTASLFPGTAVVHEKERLVGAPWVATLNTYRVTLTPPVLNHAAAVVFLVSGGDKAETLRAVLEGEDQPDVYPSQVIRPEAGELIWLVERTAAAFLPTHCGAMRDKP